jgi:TPR repeat protein
MKETLQKIRDFIAKHYLTLLLIILGIIIFALLLTKLQNHREHKIKEAKIYIREYKTAKALDIFQQLASEAGKEDSELKLLTYYTLIKSNNIEKADEKLSKIESLELKDKDIFFEVIEKLSIKPSNDPQIIKLINKAKNLKLGENFFIELSKRRNVIKNELAFLNAGKEYIKTSFSDKEVDQHMHDLNEYIIKRYIEIASIYQSSKQYALALKYLNQAKEISKKMQKVSEHKSEIYLNIGLVYKHQKKYSQALTTLKYAANLGNEQAKSLVESARL